MGVIEISILGAVVTLAALGAVVQMLLKASRRAIEAEEALCEADMEITFKVEGKAVKVNIDDLLAKMAPDTSDANQQATTEIERGRIAFNLPEQMKQFRQERIEVRLTRDDRLPAEEFVRAMRGSGQPSIEDISLIERMRVVLAGDPAAFEILNRSETDQLVQETQYTQWQWDVTPLRAGRQKLELRATCRFRLGADTEFLDLPTYEREIRIQVAPLAAAGRFGARNWQWLAATAAIPLVVWLAQLGGLNDSVRPYLDGLFKTNEATEPAETQPSASKPVPVPSAPSEDRGSELRSRASRAFQ
jgi:hypothetical protein